MLEKLLQLIQDSGTTSPVLLAESLNTTPAMVQAMLDTLEDQGYLRSMNTECAVEKPCTSCSLSNLCSTKDRTQPHVRVLVEK